MKRKVIALITVTVLVVCTSIGSVSAGISTGWVTTTQNIGGGSNFIAGLAWTTYSNSLQYHRATIKTSSKSQSGEAYAGSEAYAELWARSGYSRSGAIYYA